MRSRVIESLSDDWSRLATEHEQRSGYLDQDPQQSTLLNSSEIALVPYACVNDEWMLPDEFLLSFAQRMKQEGTFHITFYDGNVKTPEDFLGHMKRPANVPVFVFKGIEPLAVAWLNGFHGVIAFGHFCALKAARGQTEKIGRLVLEYWMSNFELRAVLGFLPSGNVLARKFIKRIGFKVLGDIPDVLYDAYAGKYVSGTIGYYAR